MSRLSPTEVDSAKLFCAKRDGLRCNNPACHKVPGEIYLDSHGKEKKTYLELDHIDNNPENNPADGTNWQLLCVPCNRLKSAKDRPRGPKFKSYEGFKKSRVELEKKYGKAMKEKLLIQYATMQKNMNAEPIVIAFIDNIIEQVGSMERGMLVTAAAQEVSNKSKGKRTIGQAAARAYLDKKCSPVNGNLEYFEDPPNSEIWFVRKRKELQ